MADFESKIPKRNHEFGENGVNPNNCGRDAEFNVIGLEQVYGSTPDNENRLRTVT